MSVNPPKIEETEENGKIPKLIDKKKWLPTTLTTGLTLIAALWALFFYGWLDLQIPLYFTIGFPFMLLFLFLIFFIYNKVHSLYKFLWVFCAGFVIGGIMWFGINFLLVKVFSTPLPEFYFLFIPPSMAIGFYLAFRWGKRRDFRPYMW